MRGNIDLKSLSGQELLKLIIDKKIAKPAMADIIAMEFISAENGKVVFKAYPGSEHLNPLGGVHGGFAATVLDSVTGCAVHSLLDSHDVYSTTDLTVKMLKPVPVNEELTADAEVISISKQIALAVGNLKDNQGQILAHAISTCFIKRAGK